MRKRDIHNLLVGMWFLYEIIIEGYLPDDLLEKSKFIAPILGLVLLSMSLHYLLRNRNENRNKTYEELISKENVGNYLQCFFLLLFTGIDVFIPFGIWVQIGMYIIALLLIITVLLKEWAFKKELISLVIVGHLFLGYILYIEIEKTYIRHYGNEIIGSYWAKPNFKAKYIVNLAKSSDLQKAHSLPAIIHVFKESHESDYPREDNWGQEYYESYTKEYIFLEKVFFNNGKYLTFDDCNLKMRNKSYCRDQDENEWLIELTEEKVE